MSKWLRRSLTAGLVAVLLGWVAVWLIGGRLAAPRLVPAGAPPPEWAAQTVSIERAGLPPVAGWFVAGDPRRAGVLLLHSVRSNRREMIGRAGFLHRAGYSVLLIDMQAHGETPGDSITFGYREARDAHAALRYLRARLPGRRVGVLGVSLGGAAALLGTAPLQADALILEGVYSTIDEAVANRLEIRLGAWGRYLAPLLLWQVELRLDISLAALRPLEAIQALRGPVLIIAGSADQHTRLHETQALFDHAPEPKSLWIVAGAKHQNLHRYIPLDYERKVLEFLRLHLDGALTAM